MSSDKYRLVLNQKLQTLQDVANVLRLRDEALLGKKIKSKEEEKRDLVMRDPYGLRANFAKFRANVAEHFLPRSKKD